MNFIKLLGVVLLSIASLAVLLAVVPIAALFLGLGIDVPSFWVPSGKVWLVYSYPWFSLVVGLGLLIVFCWAAWWLARSWRPNSR